MRRLAFSFCRTSGESDALLMKRSGVSGLPLVSPLFCGEPSSWSGVLAIPDALETRGRIGVVISVGVSSICSLSDRLDKLCSIADAPKWSNRNLNRSVDMRGSDRNRRTLTTRPIHHRLGPLLSDSVKFGKSTTLLALLLLSSNSLSCLYTRLWRSCRSEQ